MNFDVKDVQIFTQILQNMLNNKGAEVYEDVQYELLCYETHIGSFASITCLHFMQQVEHFPFATVLRSAKGSLTLTKHRRPTRHLLHLWAAEVETCRCAS